MNNLKNISFNENIKTINYKNCDILNNYDFSELKNAEIIRQ